MFDDISVYAAGDVATLVVVQIPEFSAAAQLSFVQISHEMSIGIVYPNGGIGGQIIECNVTIMIRIGHNRIWIDPYMIQIGPIKIVLSLNSERCRVAI